MQKLLNPAQLSLRLMKYLELSCPFIKSVSNDCKTSDGLGRKYDGINPVKVVRMAQIIITETGNISEIHIFLIFYRLADLSFNKLIT